MRRGRKEGMVVWCLLALLYVIWPDFHRGLLQIFLGDLFGSWSSADGLGNVRSAMSAHARVYWQQGRIRYAQPWSSPLLAPWPSLITPCSRNNNVSGAPADPYTCRHTQIIHIPNCLLRIQTCTFLILTTVISLTDAYAAPWRTSTPAPPPHPHHPLAADHSHDGLLYTQEARQNFNPRRSARLDFQRHGKL